MKFPYSQHQGTKTWRVLLRAMGDLERNGDVVLQTKKDYVVGYLALKLANDQRSVTAVGPKDKEDVFRVSDGEAYCWAEQESSVMLKAVTKSGDPVELSGDEAIELAHALLKAAKAVE
jgi:hypothetical protein